MHLLLQSVGASVRVFELLDRQSAVNHGNLRLNSLKGEVKFDNVTFSYPSRPDTIVLKVHICMHECLLFKV